MKRIKGKLNELPKKTMALLMTFAMLANYILPITVVHATGMYVVTFSATGTHTMEKVGNNLKIDGQFVTLEHQGSSIGTVKCESATSCSITVNSDEAGQLNYNSGNRFTLYNTSGHTEYSMGTKINSNTVFMVEDYAGGGNSQNSDVEVQFDNATISGNVVTFDVNNTDVSLTVTGTNISNNKIIIDRNNLDAVSFNISNTFDNDSMQVVVRGTGNYETLLAVNNGSASLSGLNFPNGGLHISIESKDNGGNNGSRITSNVTMTAGAGTYGNNRNYDAEANFSINGSRWNHGGTIDYSVQDTDTTVTFTFDTLWINRFYDNIVINGVSYNVSDYLDFDDRTEWLNANHGSQSLSFDIPNVAKADDYNIVVKHGENTGKKYLATFLWTADPDQAGGHDYIGHSKLEFVKAVYHVGNTTYTVTEEDLKGKLHRDNAFLTAESDDGFLSYGVTADVDFDDGSLTLPGDAEVTMRVVPEYGYQVTDVNNGGAFTTTSSGVSEFTVHVDEGTAGYFQAEVTRVDDEVLVNSDKVSSGTVEIANGEINSGTVRLSVDDVELTEDKIADFKDYAGENYNINSYLDINLNKVLYKGTSEDVWSEQIHHLRNKALITLKLEDGVDASNIVIVHNIDDGEEFEIIEIESYDPETNAITFYTDSFSNYAIATKTTTTDIATENPKTGDNIMFYIPMLGLSIISLTGVGFYLRKKIFN